MYGLRALTLPKPLQRNAPTIARMSRKLLRPQDNLTSGKNFAVVRIAYGGRFSSTKVAAYAYVG